MGMVVRPECPCCGVKMISIAARLGNGPDDARPTNRKSYKRVGWMCLSCDHSTVKVPDYFRNYQMPLL